MRTPRRVFGVACFFALACGSSGNESASGGSSSGAVAARSGGSGANGADGPAGGTSAGSAPRGGASTGGSGLGGTTSGGASGRGGTSSGGASSTGGAKSGGASSTGGAKSGGASSTGGAKSGGTTGSGGTASGGAANAGGGSANAGGASTGGSGGAGTLGVTINGHQLLVDGKPFRIRGVCWNPVPKGKEHPGGLDFVGLAPTDIPLMKAANINVVRTYEPLTNTAVLDQLAAAGIYVLNSVYPYGGDAASVVTGRVNAVKAHRAILMWVIGNEWNYNGLYVDLSAAASQARLNEVATLIRQADSAHPIASVYGEVPPKAVVDAMPNIDVWGINSYRGISFGDLFTGYKAVSEKPMFVSEFGADSYNATKGAYDPDSQAKATEALLREIAAQASDTQASGVALGGTVFEWADEWWKDSSGDVNAHDVGGIAPGGGPYPDQTFNEEWWGIVDIDRAPRPAYDALKKVYGGG
jgi:hypothetical protein